MTDIANNALDTIALARADGSVTVKILSKKNLRYQMQKDDDHP